jgi:hypothetical protein
MFLSIDSCENYVVPRGVQRNPFSKHLLDAHPTAYDVYIPSLGKRRKLILKVKVPLWRDFHVHGAIRVLLIGQLRVRLIGQFLLVVFKRNRLHKSAWIQGIFHCY